jgi:hypothetical protein
MSITLQFRLNKLIERATKASAFVSPDYDAILEVCREINEGGFEAVLFFFLFFPLLSSLDQQIGINEKDEDSHRNQFICAFHALQTLVTNDNLRAITLTIHI